MYVKVPKMRLFYLRYSLNNQMLHISTFSKTLGLEYMNIFPLISLHYYKIATYCPQFKTRSKL